MDLEKLIAHAKWAESVEHFPYRDTVGKLTIGVGRNLDDNGISDDEIDLMLSNDIKRVLEECKTLPYWCDLDEVRRMVVADMVFNLGFPRFLGFKKMNAALNVTDYNLAAHEMKDSRWYEQVGRRSKALHQAMLTGEMKWLTH